MKAKYQAGAIIRFHQKNARCENQAPCIFCFSCELNNMAAPKLLPKTDFRDTRVNVVKIFL